MPCIMRGQDRCERLMDGLSDHNKKTPHCCGVNLRGENLYFVRFLRRKLYEKLFCINIIQTVGLNGFCCLNLMG